MIDGFADGCSVGCGDGSDTENVFSDVNSPIPVGIVPYMRVPDITMVSILLIVLLNSSAGRVPVTEVLNRLRVLNALVPSLLEANNSEGIVPIMLGLLSNIRVFNLVHCPI